MFPKELMLTSDFLRNELITNLDLDSKKEQAKFKEYYLHICNAISDVFYLKPTMAQVVSYILSGEYDYLSKTRVLCPVTDREDRIYLFRYAQALQLKYDLYGGRAGMIRGEDTGTSLCSDSIKMLDRLGLYQRTFMSR